jgi:hypothetical protein
MEQELGPDPDGTVEEGLGEGAESPRATTPGIIRISAKSWHTQLAKGSPLRGEGFK